MSIPLKRWEVSPRAPASHFAQFPNTPPLVVQILYNRGFTSLQDVQQFLEHRFVDDDPLTLKGMPQAVERLSQAIINQESIAIYGDYDADGVTSTALMMELLLGLGAQVQAYIPNRFKEGYGLNNEALTELVNRGVKVVVTVDCGIRSVSEVTYGNSLGLDIIITDHHTVGQEIPPALAIINPKQADCPYPFKELAGVGLAHKVAQALLRSDSLNGYRSQTTIEENKFLDLVALGTVADLAPLFGENRMLVNQGLQQLNLSLRPGLAALMAQGNAKSGSSISAGTIGFVIGPRLNAAGRLDSALRAYQLLISPTKSEAAPLAAELDQQNRHRQKLTSDTVTISRQAVLADQGQSPLYFIDHPDFNPGVVGLAASRLCDEFYRPVLVAEHGPEYTKGSARSIPEFHITEALDQCADLLQRYGGHAAAAGFTVENDKLPDLKARLQEIAQNQLDVKELRPTIVIGGEVNLRGVNITLVEDIGRLQPFGYGNPTPQFLTRNLRVKARRTVGQAGSHLKLTLHDGKYDWDAIAFRQGHWANRIHISQYIDAVYSLEFNEWNGQRKLQLNIQDLRLSEFSVQGS